MNSKLLYTECCPIKKKVLRILISKQVYKFSWCNSPQQARVSSLTRLHDHTQTYHTRQDSSGQVISPSQRPLPDNTQHSQQTDIHATGGIQTRNPRNRGTADPQLRPRGHWERPKQICIFTNTARQRSLVQADHWSRAVLQCVVQLSVIVKPQHEGGPGCCAMGRKNTMIILLLDRV